MASYFDELGARNYSNGSIETIKRTKNKPRVYVFYEKYVNIGFTTVLLKCVVRFLYMRNCR